MSNVGIEMDNLPLNNMARAIARQRKDDGAIIITKSEHGFHIGVGGLSGQDVQDCLCIAIHYNFMKMESDKQMEIDD